MRAGETDVLAYRRVGESAYAGYAKESAAGSAELEEAEKESAVRSVEFEAEDIATESAVRSVEFEAEDVATESAVGRAGQ